jgi:hypothetical protein
MELLRQPQMKIIGLELTADNDGVYMFDQVGLTAE